MASSAKGLRLLKTLELIKTKPCFDATTVLKKTKLLSACDGVLKGSFKVEPAMCNQIGTIHGGYIASVVDVMSFYSQLSDLDGRVSWTVGMNITYIASAKVGETINVETKSLKTGNTSIIETYLHNDSGNLLAKGTTSFVAGGVKFQQTFKDLTGFDVYDNEEKI